MEYSGNELSYKNAFKALEDQERAFSSFSQLGSNSIPGECTIFFPHSGEKKLSKDVISEFKKIETAYENAIKQVVDYLSQGDLEPDHLKNLYTELIKIKSAFDKNEKNLATFGENIGKPEGTAIFINNIKKSLTESFKLFNDKMRPKRILPAVPFPQETGALAAKLISDHIDAETENATRLKQLAESLSKLNKFLTSENFHGKPLSNEQVNMLSLLSDKFRKAYKLTEALTNEKKKCFLKVPFDDKKSAALSSVIKRINLVNKLSGELSSLLKIEEQVKIAKMSGNAVDLSSFSDENIEYIFDNEEIENIYNQMVEKFEESKGEIIDGALLYGEKIDTLDKAIAHLRKKIKGSEKEVEKEKLGLELHKSFDINIFCQTYKLPLFSECVKAVEEAVQLTPQLLPIVNENSYKVPIIAALGEVEKYNHPGDLINLVKESIYFLAEQKKVLQRLLESDPKNRAIISAIDEIEKISITMVWELI